MRRCGDAARPRMPTDPDLHSARFPHLPALDGLRGVAVALVVGYHLAPDALPGGFLGVDVFFVLSGFLITSLLLAEAGARRGIDLRTFYLRRLRRLAPALLLLAAGLALYAWRWASPGELGRLREHTLWTLGYLANWRYIADGTTYTELVAGESPLRHTWSLAIEEQFYVAVPLLVLLAGRLTGWKPLLHRRVVLIGALAGSAASAVLMAALWNGGADPTRGYFGTDTRAHSLLVGVALGAVLVGRPPTAGLWTRWASPAAVAGLAVVGGAVAVGDESAAWLQHGGFLAVAIAVAGLIAALGHTHWLAGPLAWGPLVGLGVISYGVYLWHWPVIVVLNEARTDLDGAQLLILRLVATLALAVASYGLLERPVRRGALGRWLHRGAPLVVGGAVAAVVLLLVAVTHPPNVRRVAAAPPAPDATPVVILGDSVAHTLAGGTVGAFPSFEPWTAAQSPFDPTRVRLLSEARPACSFLPGKVVGAGPAPADLGQFCGDWRRDLGATLAEHPQALLVVALSNDGFDRQVDGTAVLAGSPTHDALLRAFLDELRALTQEHRGTLALLALPPRTGPLVPDGDQAGRRERLLRDAYQRYASDHADVRFLDLFTAICPAGDCDRPQAGFDPTWRYDGLHFDREGARWAAEWVVRRLP